MSIVGASLPVVRAENWMADALCRQIDCGDIFFIDKGESAKPAKAICACEFCGTEFMPWKNTARFCSRSCNLDSVNAQKRAST